MFLGIDLGTGSVKALLLDRRGQIVREASEPYRVNAPHPGWAESDPDEWWQATARAVRKCSEGAAIDAIGLSGQMHGLVPCDGDGVPLRPAILWADTRAVAELEAFKALSKDQRQRLANPLATGMAGVSLLWMRNHEPELYRNVSTAFAPKDWLRFRLTGRRNTEPSDASATLLYDLIADDWALDVLDEIGLRRTLLPPLVPSSRIAGELTAAAAAALGHAPGTPVAAGAGDAAAGLLGNGLVDEGIAQLQIGSGMQILTPRREAVVDATLRTHLYRDCGKEWYAMAAMQNAGLVLDWVRGLLNFSWRDMHDAGFSVSAGAEDIAFLPYLTGERTPYMNPLATGAWIGLRLHHRPAHLARAAFEGVAFSLKDGLQALEAAGIVVRDLRLVGGGTLDGRWRQLLADVLEKPLLASDSTSASARGAALLAGLACGAFQSVTQTAELATRPSRVTEPLPNESLRAAHRHFTEAYRKLHG